jgi:hypothetical protein
MFAGALSTPSRGMAWVHRLLFPVLDTDDVARAVVRGVETRRQLLVLPRWLSLVPALMHLLPVPVYDWGIRLAGGGAEGLAGFQGR